MYVSLICASNEENALLAEALDECRGNHKRLQSASTSKNVFVDCASNEENALLAEALDECRGRFIRR